MATNETEKKNVTGLDTVENRKDAEYDLVSSLLEAAEFRNSDETIEEIEMHRRGKYLFTVHLRPLSEPEVRKARKSATIYMPNPNGKKYPPIEKDVDTAKFNAWLIYMATVEDDQQKIWGNPAIMQKYGLMQPVESIDVLLTMGEKRYLADKVSDISGLNDDEEAMTEEEYAKN